MNAIATNFTTTEVTSPPKTARRILAVGAAGASAGMVIPELAKRGAYVRGLVHDRKQTVAVRDRGAAEIAVGDLRDLGSIDAALEGMDAMFYIAPAFIPDEAEIGVSVVAAAVRAGVRRVVFSSVIDPSISELVNHSAKAPVEEAIIESGMEYVLLQPALFVQGIARSWPNVLETGVFAEPWSSETLVGERVHRCGRRFGGALGRQHVGSSERGRAGGRVGERRLPITSLLRGGRRLWR